MRDDEIGLHVTDKETAEYLVSKEPVVADSLVITSVVNPRQVIMVPKQEFIDWLYEKGESNK